MRESEKMCRKKAFHFLVTFYQPSIFTFYNTKPSVAAEKRLQEGFIIIRQDVVHYI